MKTLIAFLTLLCFTISVKSQLIFDKTVSFGTSVNYNFQTKGAGFDARLLIPFNNTFSLVPRLSYFPAFNQIHEFYLGADVEADILQSDLVALYLFAGGYYNNWLNSSDFKTDKSLKTSIAFEPGVGLRIQKTCFSPFAEFRYDTKWKEGTVCVGFFISFYNCFSPQRFRKCPAYH